jgi:hypothetical protein
MTPAEIAAFQADIRKSDALLDELLDREDIGRSGMEQKKPYPIFTEPGVLTDDTVLTVGPWAGMTAKEFDDILLSNFVRNLEPGNRIMEKLTDTARFPGFDV